MDEPCIVLGLHIICSLQSKVNVKALIVIQTLERQLYSMFERQVEEHILISVYSTNKCTHAGLGISF